MTSRPTTTLFCRILICALLLAPAFAGCRWLKLGGDSKKVDQSLAEALVDKPPVQRPPTAPAMPTAAHAALARDGWNAALAPEPPFPASAEFRWRHGDLETLLTLRADERPDLVTALAEGDLTTATNAAIGLARLHDNRGRGQLVKAVEAVALRPAMRCAAAEALGRIDGAADDLRNLLDRFGSGAERTSHYSPELHAELLYGLAEQCDAAEEPRFTEALKSSETAVRLAAIRAFSLPGEGALPMIGADLRSDQDHRIRAAALQALVARRHELAVEAVRGAVHDHRLEVRLAAISCLGDLDEKQATESLEKLEFEPEIIRSAAVLAWAKLGARDRVWSAAGDNSWHVRLASAEALAHWPDADGAALARRLVKDASVEVQKQTIATLAEWPLDVAGPVLLAALADGGYATRKSASAQLAERWPQAAEFSVDAPPERREEMLAALRKTWGETHPLAAMPAAAAPEQAAAPQEISSQRLRQAEQIVRRIQEAPPTGGAMRLALYELDEFGPELTPALERLALERSVVLPDVIYRDVLAKRSPEFEALDRLTAPEALERRQAALKLAEQAELKSLSWLGLLRLAELGAREPDVLVWNSMMRAVAQDPREPAVRLAYAGLTHKSGEVRRLACEYLAAFPDRKHATVLLTALGDEQRPVVLAAVDALGHPGMLDDVSPLQNLLASNDRELRLAVAQSLVKLGAPGGPLELERLARDRDPEIRRQAAVAMGALADPTYTDALIELLSDSLGVQVAALDALPKVVGRDVALRPGNPATDTRERISRWKRWHETERRKSEASNPSTLQ